MIPRRILRVKSFQQLYAAEVNNEAPLTSFLSQLRSNIQNIQTAYIFHLYTLYRVAEKVIEDKLHRNDKYIKTEEDKHFTIRLYRNPFIQSLLKCEYTGPVEKEKKKSDKSSLKLDFLNFCSHLRLDHYWEPDQILHIYNDLKVMKMFQDYSHGKLYTMPIADSKNLQETIDALDDDTWSTEYNIINNLYTNVIMRSELVFNKMDEHFFTWADDKSIVTKAVQETIDEFFRLRRVFEPGAILNEMDIEDSVTFASEIFSKSQKSRDEINKLMEPILTNWDMERMNMVDNILIRMAITEMLDFPKIPSKVSINEYLEIAKIYSTPKSKDFINGVLDTLMKQLYENGRIIKSGSGLS